MGSVRTRARRKSKRAVRRSSVSSLSQTRTAQVLAPRRDMVVPANQQMLDIQRTHGNQAAQRWMSDKHNAVQRQRANVIQRKETVDKSAEFGLAIPSSVSKFAGELFKWAQTNGEQPASYLGREAGSMVEVRLLGLGVPKPTIKVITDTSDSSSGWFDYGEWSITVNAAQFGSGNTAATKVKNLGAENIADVGNTLYHEARHCEQFWLIARMMAGKGISAEKITEQTSIPARVANAAQGNKLNNPTLAQRIFGSSSKNKLLRDQMKMAQLWYDTNFGKYAGFTKMVKNLEKVEKKKKAAERRIAAARGPAKLQTFTREASILGRYLRFTTRDVHVNPQVTFFAGLSKKDRYTNRMENVAKASQGHINDYLAAFKVRGMTRSDRNKLGAALIGLANQSYMGYRAYTDEIDAFAVGDAVTEEYMKMQAIGKLAQMIGNGIRSMLGR